MGSRIRGVQADRNLASADDTPIQVLRPRLPPAEQLLSYIRRIDSARTYTNWGPLACELEQRLIASLGLPASSVTLASSGTTALVGAALATAGRAARSSPVAIVPAYTFIATALAAEQCGFQPYLVDVDDSTWSLQASALEHHAQLPRVGLVVPVAPFGRGVPQAPWLEFRRRTGIPVVIDGGASLEAIHADPAQFVGPIPVALSFHATKSFSTAEGGCIVTTDPDLTRRVSEALNFGFAGSRDCVRASTNGKMSEYHAAIGLAELDGWKAKRSELLRVAAAYRAELAAAGLADRFAAAPDVASSYAIFRCNSAAEAERLMRRMAEAHIESRLWYGKGLHRHPYLGTSPRDELRVTDRIAPRLVALPIAPDLTLNEVRRVVAALTRSEPD